MQVAAAMNGAPRSSRRKVASRVLLTLALVLLAALVLQPWWLAPLMAQHLAGRSGRSVHFDSLWFSLSSSLEPTLHARGVRIANAPWADARRPFAALDEVVARFAWRSLSERRPVLALMVLRGGEVDLERQADGLRNWRLSNPEDRGPGRIKIRALQADQATIRFVERGLDLDVEAVVRSAVDASGAPAATESMTKRVVARGDWRGVPFFADLAAGDVVTFLETGRSFPLKGKLEAGGARLEVDGRVADVARKPTIAAQVRLAGSSLAALQALVGPRDRSSRSFALEGRLDAADDAYRLSGMRGNVGATTFVGELGFTRPAQRVALRADLSSESADVADLSWLIGGGEPGGARRQAGRAATPEARSEPGEDAVHWAREFDADFRLAARRLRAAQLPMLQSVQLAATLTNGVLTVASLDVGVAHGHATGKASLDLQQRPPSAAGEFSVHGVRLESLLGHLPSDQRVSGQLHATARLKAAGDAPAALLASLSGSVEASLSGGTISSLLDARMGLQGGKILRDMVAGAEPIPIRCAEAVIELQRGRGHIRRLVLDTERTRTTATGTIGLANQTLDLVLTPEAKQGGLFVLDRSIHLHGPLRKPAHALVDRAPATAATCAA